MLAQAGFTSTDFSGYIHSFFLGLEVSLAYAATRSAVLIVNVAVAIYATFRSTVLVKHISIAVDTPTGPTILVELVSIAVNSTF